jgi:predicted MPP superfamily phosphohydrolase
MTRREWLRAAGVAAVASAIDALWLEPSGIRVSHHNVMSDPASGRSIRLTQISDLHLRAMDAHAERVARAINASGADVAILTGDAVDDAKNLELLNQFLSTINPSIRKLAILGNWEYWGRVNIASLRYVYDRHDCELLVNQASRLDVAGREIRFVGLDDLVGGRPDLAQAVRYVPARDYEMSVLLAHCPAYRDRDDAVAAHQAFNIMLSGHTHGGQIAPLGWAPLRPAGSGRYVRGWYDDRGRIAMYVSRGLGTSVVPARFCSPPELAVIDV